MDSARSPDRAGTGERIPGVVQESTRFNDGDAILLVVDHVRIGEIKVSTIVPRNRVKLCFSLPPHVTVMREELWLELRGQALRRRIPHHNGGLLVLQRQYGEKIRIILSSDPNDTLLLWPTEIGISSVDLTMTAPPTLQTVIIREEGRQQCVPAM